MTSKQSQRGLGQRTSARRQRRGVERCCLKVEALEGRLALDSAMAEIWKETFSNVDPDLLDESLPPAEWQVADIHQLLSGFGIEFGALPQDADVNWIGVSPDGSEAFTLKVGEYYWDWLIEDGVATLYRAEEQVLHNAVTPTDINGDQNVNVVDALVAINHLNRNGGAMMLPSRGEGALVENMFDVNGDNWLSAMDALMVINELRRQNAYEAGGSKDSPPWSSDDSSAGDWFTDVGSDDGTPKEEFPPRDGADGIIDDDGSNSMDDPSDGDGLDPWDGAHWGGGFWDGGEFAGGAVDDYVNIVVESGSVLPTITIDVLANDIENAALVKVGEPMVGTVEWIPSIEEGGRTVLQYTPGPWFNGYDSFLYMISDANGAQSIARVYVSYEQPAVGFEVIVPEVVVASPGASTQLVDDDGNPLISIQYEGERSVQVGVLISWAAPEWPYNGDTFSGRITLENVEGRNGVYPDGLGGIWVSGTLEEVNQILTELVYEPAPGFTAENGAGVSVYAYLYDRLQVGYVSSEFLLKVPQPANAPKAVDDVFEINSIEGVYAFDVLANDVSLNGNSAELELVDVTLSEHFLYSEVEIDSLAGLIKYKPTAYFSGLDIFSYTVRNRDGELSQGIVRVQMPLWG